MAKLMSLRVKSIRGILTACLMAGVIVSSASASFATSSGKATGSTWTLGTIGTYSGAESSTTDPGQGVLQAWEKWTNTHGGIDGHPVKIIFKDDQEIPSVALADAETLVHDGVPAIIGEVSAVFPNWVSVVEKAKLPVVGGNPPNPPFGTSTDLYLAGSSLPTATALGLAAAKAVGGTKVADLYCAEISVCAEFLTILKPAVSQAKMALVYDAAVSATAPNYTAPCLAAKASGANVLILTLANQTLKSIVDQCAAQGYHPTIVGQTGQATPSWTSDPNFKGAVGPIDEFGWWDTKFPRSGNLQRCLEEVRPNRSPKPNVGG